MRLRGSALMNPEGVLSTVLENALQKRFKCVYSHVSFVRALEHHTGDHIPRKVGVVILNIQLLMWRQVYIEPFKCMTTSAVAIA